MDTFAFREKFRKEIIPQWYRGQLHLIFSGSILLGVMTSALSKLVDPNLALFLMIPGTILLGNFVVFFIHKYPLHRKLFPSVFYKIHTRWHHRFFTHEHLVCERAQDMYMLLFPMHVVFGVNLIISPLVASLFWINGDHNIGWMVMFCTAMYFSLYEIFHSASHLPKDHLVLKIPGFAYMREHHRLHHAPQYMSQWNFNVVYPLADFLMGTSLKHSQRASKQSLPERSL